MAPIIFLFLALVANILVSGQAPCKDTLGHCNIVKANCRSQQAEQQMRKLCARTCGFCQDEPVVVATKAPAQKSNAVERSSGAKAQLFTLEVFLMYLKNDIKFLKEEMSDVKTRLRVVEKRKGQTGFNSDLDDLKLQTSRLFTRLSDQTNQFSRLMSNLSTNIFETKTNFRTELITIRREITQMNDELKADVEKLASFSNFNDQLKDVQENIHDMTKRSQVTLSTFADHIRNLSLTVSDRYVRLQSKFFATMNNERVKVAELGNKLENVTRELFNERQRNEKFERFMKDFSAVKIGEIMAADRRRIDDLSRKLANVTQALEAQNLKTSMLTALVNDLSKKQAASVSSTTVSSSSSELEVQQQTAIKQLQSKFNYVIRRLEAQLQATRILQYQLNVTRTFITSAVQAPISQTIAPGQAQRIESLRRELGDVKQQLEALKNKPAQGVNQDEFKKIIDTVRKQAGGIPSGPRVPFRTVNASGAPGTVSDIHSIQRRIESESVRVQLLETRVEEIRRNTTGEVKSIRDNIGRMALWRNNKTANAAEITKRYTQGIMSLLGPDQGNSTRFFNPKINWENGRLAILGYIAINREGEWGTICDDAFGEEEAEVLCRMAGYNGGAFDNGQYNIGDGKIDDVSRADHKIWIDELRCDGNELSIEDCRYGSEGWGIHDCDHGEDVGIKCYVA